MELGFYFLFLQEQIKDIIIVSPNLLRDDSASGLPAAEGRGVPGQPTHPRLLRCRRLQLSHRPRGMCPSWLREHARSLSPRRGERLDIRGRHGVVHDRVQRRVCAGGWQVCFRVCWNARGMPCWPLCHSRVSAGHTFLLQLLSLCGETSRAPRTGRASREVRECASRAGRLPDCLEELTPPCLPCPFGSYQSNFGAQECNVCAEGQNTMSAASTRSSDCVCLPGFE